MNSRSSVRDSVLLLVIALGAISPHSAPAFQQPPGASTTNTFPYTKEVIPGKLKVRIFLHHVHDKNGAISCWSYVSDGLWALKQKELIFTLRRDPGQKPEDYPHDILDLLVGIYHLAEDGKLVDVGSVSLFGEQGFMKRDVLGIGYVDPQAFPEVQTPKPLLAAVFLKGDEAGVALALGLTRVTDLLGMQYRYYPCPPWSDLNRDPVLSRKDMQKSVLLKLPTISVRASYYEEENRVFLSLLPAAREKLNKTLSSAPPEQPLALLTNVDHRANASMVWKPNQTQPVAISPPNSPGSRRTGNFLALVPEQKEIELMKVEDGYSIFLTSSAWQLIRTALKDGTDVSIPASKPGGAAISVEWVQTDYTSPVTGGRYTSEGGWADYKPETPQSPKPGDAVSGSRIVLLTSDDDIRASTTVDEVAAYFKGIQREVESYFQVHDPKVGHSISVHLELEADGKAGIKIVATPEMDTESLNALHGKLTAVPAARTSGPIRLEVIFTIRGGPGI